jgi:hypothetical protein
MAKHPPDRLDAWIGKQLIRSHVLLLSADC